MEYHWIEFNGEHFQSVFPSIESEKTYPHTTIKDAYDYMTKECGVDSKSIKLALELMRYKITSTVIAQAGKILCCDSNTIENQLETIIACVRLDNYDDLLDNIKGVDISEQFENTFSVGEFLEHLPFKCSDGTLNNNNIQSVQDLIDALEELKDHSVPILAYAFDNTYKIERLDVTKSGRVYIDLKKEE